MSTLLERFWGLMARHPVLALIGATAAQTALTFSSRSLWYSDEVRYADAYRGVLDGHWLVLSLNGLPYPDKPPVYFWFVALVDKLTPGNGEAHFFVAAALTGLFFVWAVYGLARALGRSRETGLAAGLVVLTCLFFSGILHYSRMDLLFAALIVAAHACLFKEAANDKRTWWPVAGLALAGLAVLVKGPLGLVFPLLSFTAFLLWRGRAKKLFTPAVGLGLLAAAAICAAWIGAAWYVEGGDFLHTVFVEQIYERATNTFHHKEGPFWYLAVLPLTWLPWTLLLAVLPLGRLFRAEFWRGLRRGRKQDNADGPAFLWVWWLSSFVLLSILSGKVVIYVLPLFAPLAILTALRLETLDESRRRLLFALLAGFLCLLGGLTLFGNALMHFDMQAKGLWLTGGVLIVGGGLLLALRKASYRAWLTALLLCVTVWVNALCLATAPSLDHWFSPREQAEVLGEYAAQGYLPVAFDIYPGIYTYYAGTDIVEIPSGGRAEVARLMAEHPRVVAAFKKKHYDEWGEDGGRPEGLTVVHEQWIVDQPYILVVSQRPGTE